MRLVATGLSLVGYTTVAPGHRALKNVLDPRPNGGPRELGQGSAGRDPRAVLRRGLRAGRDGDAWGLAVSAAHHVSLKLHGGRGAG